MSHNATPNTSRVELRKTLTLVPVVMMGLAYMQPMTLFDTFGIVSGMTDGHVPTAYAFALIAILFTALSYGKLVRRYPSAGSAYTYAQKSISPTVGFMVGWSSLLDYLFAPMINILLAKIYFEALVPSIPSWVFVIALVAFMTAFNLRSIKSVANFNTVIVVLQVVLIAVILGMVIYGVFEGEGAGTLASSRPFWSGDAHVIPMITGATILCFSFTGFDGISPSDSSPTSRVSTLGHCLNQVVDAAGRVGGAPREILDLIGDDGKATTFGTGLGGDDAGVEREQVGALG